jgi:hypothetical protein
VRSLSKLLILLTILGSVTFAVAPASAEKSDADAAIVAALQRIADRTHTPADVKLITSHPEIAAKVGDPDRPPTVKVTASDLFVNSVNDLTCQWFTGEITSYTYLGFVHWMWKHSVEVCWDGVVVVQWRNRFDSMTYSDGTAYQGPLLADSASQLPATPAASFFQRRIDICVFRYGCYASYAPWSQFNLNGDGSFWWNWGAPGG